MSHMPRYTFIWSPEGRPIITFPAVSLARAKAYFRSKYRASYGRYMGEMRIEIDFQEGSPEWRQETNQEVR